MTLNCPLRINMPPTKNTMRYYMLQKAASSVYRAYIKINHEYVHLPKIEKKLKHLHYEFTLAETERYWATNGDPTHDKDCIANYRSNEQFIRSKK